MKHLVQQNANDRRLSALCIILILFLTFLFLLTARAQFLITYSEYADSSVFQYIARVILDGGIPYRDTFDHKGPLIYLLNVLALWMSESYGLWCIEFLNLFIFFLLGYSCARLFCKKITSFFVVLTIIPLLYQYFEGGNLTEEYALPFITGALYIFTDYFLNQKITRLRLFLCGACLGAVLLLRVNMIAIWIVMSIGVLVQCIYCRSYKQIYFFLFYFILGLVAFVLPFILWLALHDGLEHFWYDYILFNFVYSSDSQRANIYAKINSFLTFLHTQWMISGIAVLGISYYKKRDLLNILFLLCLFISLLLTCISGQDYGHYGMVLIPLLIIPMAYIGKACEAACDNQQLCNIFVVACLLTSMLLPTWQELVNHAVYSYQARGVHIHPFSAAISSWIKENTTPEDQILVCGNWNELYNRSDRFAATKYSYQTPICDISSDLEEEFFEEITNNVPTAIVLPVNFYAYDQMMSFINTHHYTQIFIDEVDNSIALFILP